MAFPSLGHSGSREVIPLSSSVLAVDALDGQGQEVKDQRLRSKQLNMLGKGFLLGVLTSGCAWIVLSMLGVVQWGPAASTNGTPQSADMSEITVLTGTNVFSQIDPTLLEACRKRTEQSATDDWDAIGVQASVVNKSVVNAFHQLGLWRMTTCKPKLPGMPWDASDFLQGGPSVHYLHAHHKFASDCESETFKLHFFVERSGELDDSSFVVEMSHDFATDMYRMIRTEPGVCDITPGAASAPRAVSNKAALVKEAAHFAVAELNYIRSVTAGCKNKAVYELVTSNPVKSVIAQVTQGIQYNMILHITNGQSGRFLNLPVVVIEQLYNNRKVRQLVWTSNVTEPKWCHLEQIWDEGSAPTWATFGNDKSQRRLGKDTIIDPQSIGGALDEDATELRVAQKELLRPRRLGLPPTSRPPLINRHIRTGGVGVNWDPRGNECFAKVLVYDQGNCGSAYANAVAQMIGIRLCLEQHGRRLAETQVVEGRKLGAIDCEDTPGWVDASGLNCLWFQAHDKGCFELADDGPWVGEQSTNCLGSCPLYCAKINEPPSTCSDSTIWSAKVEGEFGKNCKWYHTSDPGCFQSPDVGQRTYCKKTCGTCQPETQFTDPWPVAWKQYMPSVNDIAQCANSNGDMNQCDGGTMGSVWNNWMRRLERNLWTMSEYCMPYTMKCLQSDGVINPFHEGECDVYNSWKSDWHKPCSCIPPHKKELAHRLQCPTEDAVGECAISVPSSFFIVKAVGQGLDIADAVTNMQRHILEFGPVYASFTATDEFVTFWDNVKPDQTVVFTGGGIKIGGHAVILLGWGTAEPELVDYWIFRNSWGPHAQMSGYGYYQRGVNLNGIETTVGATMPVTSFPDWAEPVCNVNKWWLSWISMKGGTLNSYKVHYQVACSEDSTMKAFFSHRLSGRDQVSAGIKGMWQEGIEIKARQEFTLVAELVDLDFGLSDGQQWLALEATDSAGNVGKESIFTEIPARPGANKFD